MLSPDVPCAADREPARRAARGPDDRPADAARGPPGEPASLSPTRRLDSSAPRAEPARGMAPALDDRAALGRPPPAEPTASLSPTRRLGFSASRGEPGRRTAPRPDRSPAAAPRPPTDLVPSTDLASTDLASTACRDEPASRAAPAAGERLAVAGRPLAEPGASGSRTRRPEASGDRGEPGRSAPAPARPPATGAARRSGLAPSTDPARSAGWGRPARRAPRSLGSPATAPSPAGEPAFCGAPARRAGRGPSLTFRSRAPATRGPRPGVAGPPDDLCRSGGGGAGRAVRRPAPACSPIHPLLTRVRACAIPQTTMGATGVAPIGKVSGDVLLSHPVTRAVPSAQKGLASGFGMGPGVSPSPWPPKRYGDVGQFDRTPRTAQWTRSKSMWQVLGLLVPVSYMRCRTSTSGLSTRWSTRGPYSTEGWETSS